MKYLLFDTETTDLTKASAANAEHQPHIVEFYGVLCEEDGSVIEELDTLVNPGFPISETTTRITGLTDKDLATAPTFREVAPKIHALVGKSNAVVAHNLSFDFMVLSVEMQRLGLKLDWPLCRICTVEQTEHLKGFRLKLIDLHTHLFGRGFESAHRARYDVMAMKSCFFHLLKEDMI